MQIYRGTNFSEEPAAIVSYDEDKCDMFFRNVGIYLPNYTMSHPKDRNLGTDRRENLKSHSSIKFHLL
jgi:hypothetical protein